MDNSVKKLIDRSNKMFEDRYRLLQLWQEFALNFYVIRADFTIDRSMGEEFAEHLLSSYPLLVQRDLANQVGAMLRPRQKEWYRMKVMDPDISKKHDVIRWLQEKTAIQTRLMYSRGTNFRNATIMGDNDFTTFGNAVIQIDLNSNRDRLLYQNWHLRDCAWAENEEGMVDQLHHKWKPTAADLVRKFGENKVHQKVREAFQKDPLKKFECRHIVMPADLYPDAKNQRNLPFVSLQIDTDNEFVMEEVPKNRFGFAVPRWARVSGSPYAYSPASVTATPDARLLQQMTLTILEAGEKSANPPLIATQEMVTSDIAAYAGGVTWVDAEYDERMGDVLRPISQDYRGLPFAHEMAEMIKQTINEAFYINQLTLPPIEGGVTAYEISQRVQEYIRRALPLFEPMEIEYNGAICEETFTCLFEANAFGSKLDIPRELRGANVEFEFESPLHDSLDELKANKLPQSANMLATAAQMDPTVMDIMDLRTAVRDSLQAIRVPQEWLRTPEQAQQLAKQREEMMQAQEQLAAGESAAKMIKGLSGAERDLAAA